MQPSRIDQLLAWLAIDSTTGREGAYLERLEADLRAEGLPCTRQPVADGRWNLLAAASDDPEVVLCTHVDTVPPFIPPTRHPDRIHGRGACDTKGVLAAMLEARARLTDDEARRVGVLLVVGEEVDHVGAKVAEREVGWRPRRILLGEPTVCEIAAAQKGGVSLRLTAAGVAGHSAFPDAGVSAVHRLLDGIAALRAEPWPTDPVMGPTHLNVGQIQGGVAANIFAPEAEALAFFRAVSDSDALVARARELCAPHHAEGHVRSMSQPLRFDPPPEGVATCVVPFNSDAHWLASLGPVWLGGPGDIRVAHSDHEHITLEQLEAGAALYVTLIRGALA